MGALVQRSEPVRDATWDDFDSVAQMLARQSRAAGGGPAERPEFVRTEWELPGFEVGRDNWVGPGRGYSAVTPAGALVLAARDETAADALLARATQCAGERRLASLQL